MDPVREMTEPPWACVSHGEAAQATNLDFIEARNNKLGHIGAIMRSGVGLLQNLYGSF